MRTLYDNNGRGMVIECTHSSDRWLAEQAIAHYAWDTDSPYDESLWLEAINDRYGAPALSRPLLTAMEQASQIIGRQVMLTHSQSGAFFPQLIRQRPRGGVVALADAGGQNEDSRRHDRMRI